VLQGGVLNGRGTVSVVNGPDIKAANTRENPDAVRTVETSVEASGTSLRCTLEPHSVAAFTLPIS